MLTSFSQDLEVGLLRHKDMTQIDFAYMEGSYMIEADTLTFGAVLPNEFVSIRMGNEGKVLLRKGVRSIGSFDEVRLIPTGENHAMRLRPRQPILKERKYRDGFSISAGEKGLRIVNLVSYKHYLEGVIESEGGGGKHLEYYKAQAVISRTYALKHRDKHLSEGFQLCDQVHCQAYHNMLRFTDEIKTAVAETKGVYMVDTLTNELVDGYFHANCGGQTSPSDYVWRENIPYLQPFKDTFCIHTRQATWTKKISKVEWREFIVNNYFYPIADSAYREQLYSFQQKERKAFYISPHLGIPLRDLRYHFKLKSTYFSVRSEGQLVVVEGRGFGHGIGLCQEGAMNMAQYGMDYRQILKFYYEGIVFEHLFERMYFGQSNRELFDF
jgi:stage II sporulation protein D